MSVFLALRSAVLSIPRTYHVTQGPLTTSPLFQNAIRGMIVYGKVTIRTHPKNSQIQYETVDVLDSDGSVQPAQSLAKILERLDTTTHTVRLVNENPPTVRILTRMEEKLEKLERKALKKVKEKRHQVMHKEVELRWSTDGKDFDRTIEKIKEDLRNGIRVSVILKGGKGKPHPKWDEKQQQAQHIADLLADAGDEPRDRAWTLGSVTMWFQGYQRRKATLPSPEEIAERAKREIEQSERSVANSKRRQEEKKEQEEAWKQLNRDPSP